MGWILEEGELKVVGMYDSGKTMVSNEVLTMLCELLILHLSWFAGTVSEVFKYLLTLMYFLTRCKVT